MIAECHYKNGGVRYHEMPVPMPLHATSGKPIFKIPEFTGVSIGTTEDLKNPPRDIIHTFMFDHNKEYNGSTMPVFYEI